MTKIEAPEGAGWPGSMPRSMRYGGMVLMAGLVVALGGIAGAYADSGEPAEVQGTTFVDLNIGDVAIACLPGGECVDGGGALLKAFDPDFFVDPQEVGDATVLEFDTAVKATAFGGIEGRKVIDPTRPVGQQKIAADRFCWTFPLPKTGGPDSRKPSGSLVCVEVRADDSCMSNSNPKSCGPTSCGNSSILLKAGKDGDPICTFVAEQMAGSITFGTRSFEAVIGFDTSRTGQNGSVTLATCAGFKPVCVNPGTFADNVPVPAEIILNTIPLAAVDTPKLVKMGGLWCDTVTGKCF